MISKIIYFNIGRHFLLDMESSNYSAIVAVTLIRIAIIIIAIISRTFTLHKIWCYIFNILFNPHNQPVK